MRFPNWRIILAASLLLTPLHAHSDTPSNQQAAKTLIEDMATTEVQARQNRTLFSFTSEERSTRTEGHLWKEKVVERQDGILRRLISVDGKPLDPERSAAEQRRLADYISHPDDFARDNQGRRDDGARAAHLLSLLPRAFLFVPDGTVNGCQDIAFRPNPAFEPSSFEERVIHTMAGHVFVLLPQKRLCGIQARIIDRVDFAYGLLGHVNPGGHLDLQRVPATARDWKTSRLSVHVDGKVLFLKTISRDQESSHYDFHPLPQGLSMSDAVALSRP